MGSFLNRNKFLLLIGSIAFFSVAVILIFSKNRSGAESGFSFDQWVEQKGGGFIARGEYEEGIEWTKRVLEERPDIKQVHLYAGLFYHHLGAEQEALSSLAKMIEVFPDRPLAYIYTGLCYSALGLENEARRSFEQGIDVLENVRHSAKAACFKDLVLEIMSRSPSRPE